MDVRRHCLHVVIRYYNLLVYWCLGGVSVVSYWCLEVCGWSLGGVLVVYGGDLSMSLWPLDGVSVVTEWCPGGVLVVSRWCLGGVSVVSWWCLGGLWVVSLDLVGFFRSCLARLSLVSRCFFSVVSCKHLVVFCCGVLLSLT